MVQAFVFIDGGNFYFKLKELVSLLEGKFSLLEFSYYGFAEWLVQPHSLIEVQYVGIAKGQSFGLTKASNDVRLLRPEDITPFLSSSLV